MREKLRSKLYRSPDPDEVEEEMCRDKGFRGCKQKQRKFFVKEEKNSSEVETSDEDMRSPPDGDQGNRLTLHAFQGEMHKGQVREDMHAPQLGSRAL